jgi:hypothetical protein
VVWQAGKNRAASAPKNKATDLRCFMERLYHILGENTSENAGRAVIPLPAAQNDAFYRKPVTFFVKGRASAFTFSVSKIFLTAACFEEKDYHEVEEGEEGRKKGPESKNFFDCEPSVRFDLAVKILLKPGSFPEHKSKRRYPA